MPWLARVPSRTAHLPSRSPNCPQSARHLNRWAEKAGLMRAPPGQDRGMLAKRHVAARYQDRVFGKVESAAAALGIREHNLAGVRVRLKTPVLAAHGQLSNVEIRGVDGIASAMAIRRGAWRITRSRPVSSTSQLSGRTRITFSSTTTVSAPVRSKKRAETSGTPSPMIRRDSTARSPTVISGPCPSSIMVPTTVTAGAFMAKGKLVKGLSVARRLSASATSLSADDPTCFLVMAQSAEQRDALWRVPAGGRELRCKVMVLNGKRAANDATEFAPLPHGALNGVRNLATQAVGV